MAEANLGPESALSYPRAWTISGRYYRWQFTFAENHRRAIIITVNGGLEKYLQLESFVLVLTTDPIYSSKATGSLVCLYTYISLSFLFLFLFL